MGLQKWSRDAVCGARGLTGNCSARESRKPREKVGGKRGWLQVAPAAGRCEGLGHTEGSPQGTGAEGTSR